MKIQLVQGDNAISITIKGKSTKKFKRVAKHAQQMLPLEVEAEVEVEEEEEKPSIGFIPHLSAEIERAEDE